MQANRILIHYAEITLKGRNRRDFENILRSNVRKRLAANGVRWPLRRAHQRLMVEVPASPDHPVEDVLALLNEVAGIASISPAVFIPAERIGYPGCGSSPRVELIEEVLIDQARRIHRPGAAFAVRVNRAEKRFPGSSDTLGARLGSAIFTHSDWDKVNLSHPDQTFYVDIYAEGVYCHTEKRKGIGGLPVKGSGHVLSLLSGGIDSPVAAYLMSKRGCSVDFIHLTATRVQQSAAEDSVVAKIARQLSRYTLRSRLFLVPYTHFDLAVMAERTGYDVVMFRRFLARTAQAVAKRVRAPALVSGDSLGQVASQTLENLVSTSRAADIPILRPLIGFDKHEIVGLAQRIGTFELSIQPYKDCCALLSENPRTKSRHGTLNRIEHRLMPDYDGLVARTLSEMVCLEFECGKLVAQRNAAETLSKGVAETTSPPVSA